MMEALPLIYVHYKYGYNMTKLWKLFFKLRGISKLLYL